MPLQRFPRILLVAVLSSLLAGCSSKSDTGPVGPDAGTGCDDSIYAHCTFDDPPPNLGPICEEFSGGRVDASSCNWDSRFITPGTYAAGPCPRTDYDKSCTLTGGGQLVVTTVVCRAKATLWAKADSPMGPDGIAGWPPCEH